MADRTGAPTRLRIRIGARTSPLARAQADQVAGWLQAAGHTTEFVGITTTGDVDQRSLTQIGGTGVFVGAVREALYDRRIDVAVHSLKDLPTAPAAELEVAATPAREDARDVLVGRTLDSLRDGDRIGTGSPRRALQLTELARAAGHRARCGRDPRQRRHPDRSGGRRGRGGGAVGGGRTAPSRPSLFGGIPQRR